MVSSDLSFNVNGANIKLDMFTTSFVAGIVNGMLGTLRDAAGAKKTIITVTGQAVNIELDGKSLTLNPFVNDICRNTLFGMASSLRGVKEIDNLEIHINE